MVTFWEKKKKSVQLLTNNFDMEIEDIREIYLIRCTIESLYKKLKQNFPLHFFYGDYVNAIQVQTWVVLIPNLLCTVMQSMIERNLSFSQIVTMVINILMYYIDFISFMEDLSLDESTLVEKNIFIPPKIPSLFDYGGLFIL